MKNITLTQEQKESKIRPLINDQVSRLEYLGNPTREEAQKLADKWNDINIIAMFESDDNKMSKEEKRKVFDEWSKDIGAINCYEMIDAFEETLSLDLISVEGCKYLIFSQDNEEAIKSPSGYHPDEKVFVQNKLIMIGSNTLKNIPQSNVEMRYIKLNQCH